jgi:cell division protein FtsN
MASAPQVTKRSMAIHVAATVCVRMIVARITIQRIKGMTFPDHQPKETGDKGQKPGEKVDYPADLAAQVNYQNYREDNPGDCKCPI